MPLAVFRGSNDRRMVSQMCQSVTECHNVSDIFHFLSVIFLHFVTFLCHSVTLCSSVTRTCHGCHTCDLTKVKLITNINVMCHWSLILS
jgi:hypothetical protein